jgi:predicted RNA methylase
MTTIRAQIEAYVAARDVEGLRELRAKTRAIEAYARELHDEHGAALETQRLAAEAALRIERGLGELCVDVVDRTPKAKRTGNSPLPVLADLRISKSESSRWQRLARINSDAFDAYLVDARERQEKISATRAIAATSPEIVKRDRLSQWDTDPKLARRMVDWLEPALARGDRVLEPSAGRGALVSAVLERGRGIVDAIEIDPMRCDELEQLGRRVRVHRGDYLERVAPERRYRAAITNPPFTDGAETAHLAKLLRECEHIVALLPARSLHGHDRYELVWRNVGAASGWYLRRKAHLVGRAAFAGTSTGGRDELVVIDLSREPGPCEVEWWTLDAA